MIILIKSYKFKSASIKIYSQNTLKRVVLVKLFGYEINKEKLIPEEYFMHIGLGNKWITNSSESLDVLKSSLFIRHSKKLLRENEAREWNFI